MEAATVRTVQDLEWETSLPRKRKYTSKACTACRKLKIRCQERTAADGSSSCEHCLKTGASCSWPDIDARKWSKVRQHRHSSSPTGMNAVPLHASLLHQESSSEHVPGNDNNAELPDGLEQHSGPISGQENSMSGSVVDTTPHTVLQYYRYLGSTAIAPGYKKISLKATNDGSEASGLSSGTPSTQLAKDPDMFDPRSNLPRAELLPHLLDAFFEYYGGSFCFLNRQQLEKLISTNEISGFLLCSLAALSARFCSPQIFEPYFPSTNGQIIDRWQYSLPFLIQAKKLLMPLLSIPSCDLVAGLLFLALAEFGDNNEAGI